MGDQAAYMSAETVLNNAENQLTTDETVQRTAEYVRKGKIKEVTVLHVRAD